MVLVSASGWTPSPRGPKSMVVCAQEGSPGPFLSFVVPSPVPLTRPSTALVG